MSFWHWVRLDFDDVITVNQIEEDMIPGDSATVEFGANLALDRPQCPRVFAIPTPCVLLKRIIQQLRLLDHPLYNSTGYRPLLRSCLYGTKGILVPTLFL